MAGSSLAALVWVVGGLQRSGAFVVAFQFFAMAVATGLVMLDLLFVENRLTRFFASARWYPLARISYGVYLVHPIIREATGSRWGVGER